MAQQFTPVPALLQNLMKLLALARDPSPEAQTQARVGSEQFQTRPDYLPHLAFLLSSAALPDRYLRQLAGLMLKNFVKRHYATCTDQAKTAAKQLVVRGLGDEHIPVRRTVGLVITTIISKEEGFSKWPGLLEGLISALDSPQSSPTLRDGALICVEMLCEDVTRDLEDHPQRPLNTLVPILIRILSRGAEVERLRALRSLNAFVADWPGAMKVNSEAFLNAVFASANSTDVEVCRQICRTFNNLCDVKPDLIGPYINSVATFMLAQTAKSDDSDLQCEACEFWEVLSQQVLWHDALKAKVPALLPLLLDGMMYTMADVEAVLEFDDSSQPLAERLVAPWFAKKRRARGGGGDDDDDDGDDPKAAADPSMAWSMRKAAAAGLDAVCGAFGDPVLAVLMPLLRERLQAQRWAVREAAILALGASAGGTINGLVPMLGGLMGNLLQILESAASQQPQKQQQHVLVVATTCWTLGRVSSWAVRQPQDNLLERSVRALAQLLGSGSRRVQDAALSALTVVCDETWQVCKKVSESNVVLAPMLGPVVSALMNVFPRYQAKTLLLAYDLLGVVLRGVATESLPKVSAIVWPVLLRACQTTPPDRRLVALLDAIATVTLNLGASVAPHAAPLMARSLQLGLAQLRAAGERARAEAGLLAQLRAERPECTATEAGDVVLARLGVPSFDLDFAIVALDLCGAVCEVLGAKSGPALASLPLGDLLRESVMCSDSSVRQAVFALVGDLARNVWDLIAPVSGALLAPLLESLYASNVSLCMNASWALGEICVRTQIPAQAAQEACSRLRRVLARAQDSGLLRNVAITLCRLAPLCSALLASTLAETGPLWLAPLASVHPGADRDRSHEVVLSIFRLNLPVALAQLPRICALIHSWQNIGMPPSVKAAAKDLFQQLMGSPEWQKRWMAVQPEMQQYVQKQLS